MKDVKLRTFITEDKGRDDLVQHVYDITYGTIRRNIDTLVVIDDSIVRGTTWKKVSSEFLIDSVRKKLSFSPQHPKYAILIATALICRKCMSLLHFVL